MKRTTLFILILFSALHLKAQDLLCIHSSGGIQKIPISYIESITLINNQSIDNKAQNINLFYNDGQKGEYKISDIDSLTFESRMLMPKQGFVVFRVDDNHPSTEMIPMAKLMEKYGYKMVWAFNSALINVDKNDLIKTLNYFQQHGHEIVDHTPNHTTGYADILNSQNIRKFSGRAGVEKIIGNRVIFDWVYPDLSKCISLNDSIETTADSSIIKFNTTNITTDDHVYTSEFGWVCVKNIVNNQATAIQNKTRQDLIYSKSSKEQLYKVNYLNVHPTVDGMKSLLLASQLNFESLGINYYKYWCHPGGTWAHSNTQVIHDACFCSGYQGGSELEIPQTSILSYNQSDSLSRWCSYPGAVSTKNSTDLIPSDWEKLVAGEIAKHNGFIDLGHMWYRYPPHGKTLTGTDEQKFQQFFDNLEEMLRFCYNNNIHVLSYNDVVRVLYDGLPHPDCNIIPPLYVNLTHQGFPDGYTLDVKTMVVETLGVTEDHGFCLKHYGNGVVFWIKKMGGFEKGQNTFSFYAKTNDNSNKYIRVKISSEQTGKTYQTINVPISGASDSFVKFQTTLDIPAYSDLYTLEVDIAGNDNQDFYISGMYLGK